MFAWRRRRRLLNRMLYAFCIYICTTITTITHAMHSLTRTSRRRRHHRVSAFTSKYRRVSAQCNVPPECVNAYMRVRVRAYVWGGGNANAQTYTQTHAIIHNMFWGDAKAISGEPAKVQRVCMHACVRTHQKYVRTSASNTADLKIGS